MQPFAELSRRGTTVVYKAYQRSLDRFVLLKRLRAEHRGDEVLARRFEAEARLAARIRHPNVVALHAYGHDDEGAYLVAEFVEGMDLAALLARGRLPVGLAVYVLEAAARGLEAAHACDVLHRDLKPSNILLSYEGAVKLADFGMASLGPQSREAADAEVRGTLAYLPPEQVLGHPATGASDLFSLGATFFEMLAGRRAFAGRTPGDLFDAVLNHDPVPLLAANPRVPADLVAICRRLLARDPSARYAACAPLLDDLRAFRRRSGLAAGADDLRRFLEDPAAYRERDDREHAGREGGAGDARRGGAGAAGIF